MRFGCFAASHFERLVLGFWYVLLLGCRCCFIRRWITPDVFDQALRAILAQRSSSSGNIKCTLDILFSIFFERIMNLPNWIQRLFSTEDSLNVGNHNVGHAVACFLRRAANVGAKDDVVERVKYRAPDDFVSACMRDGKWGNVTFSALVRIRREQRRPTSCSAVARATQLHRQRSPGQH